MLLSTASLTAAWSGALIRSSSGWVRRSSMASIGQSARIAAKVGAMISNRSARYGSTGSHLLHGFAPM